MYGNTFQKIQSISFHMPNPNCHLFNSPKCSTTTIVHNLKETEETNNLFLNYKWLSKKQINYCSTHKHDFGDKNTERHQSLSQSCISELNHQGHVWIGGDQPPPSLPPSQQAPRIFWWKKSYKCEQTRNRLCSSKA